VGTLLLLRHAKSSWDDPSLADVDRPLAPRGEKAARTIARYLLEKRVRPDLVLCSTSRRTRQTFEAIEPSLGRDVPVEYEQELYGASEVELLARIRTVSPEVGTLLLLGHNPGMQDLALLLAGRGARLDRLREKFPTAALATLAAEDGWAELKAGVAELVDYVVPRELG
jgi:phosphohistidine phosphatase